MPLYLFLIVGGLIGLGGVAFLSRSVVVKQLDEWQVLPQPERFSELYFTSYRRLPTSLMPNTTQTVSFTIHNLEQRTMTYQYKLVAVSPTTDAEHVLGLGRCTLANSQRRNISRIVTIPELGTRLELRIDLTYVGRVFGNGKPVMEMQSIHYWSDLTHPATVNKGGQ